MNDKKKWLLLMSLVVSMALAFGLNVKAGQPVSSGVNSDVFHHHIHNFYLNDSDKSKPNYMAVQLHASAMSYDGVTHYLLNKLPGSLDDLNRILLHNAYYIPISINFKDHSAKFTVSYQTANNISAINKNRVVWKDYPIDNSDVDLVKGYACAKSSDYVQFNKSSSYDDAEKWFRIDKDYKKLIANWQSKYVVEQLANATLQTLNTKKYDDLFLDDMPRDPGDCVNKSFGGKGFYTSWKAGQLAFLQKITDGARAINGYHGKPIKVFGNVWSPHADAQTAKWYASKQLRLDHYYFESGGFAREDLIHGQVASSVDPETGLPAFKPMFGDGYIPANLVSLGTHIETMNALTKPETSSDVLIEYLNQHYKAAGIAAKQGSWFGWYGETSVDKLDAKGQLIHSNEMQLLRCVPNWENIAKIPLSQRQYSQAKQEYISENSQFNDAFVLSKNPLNQELYVVFKSQKAKLDLKGKQIVSAYFVNDYFTKTSDDAMQCLIADGDGVYFDCPRQLKRGIRIVTN